MMAHKLRDTRAYRQIAAYCQAHPEESLNAALNALVTNCRGVPDIDVHLRALFVWQYTPQGHEYWARMFNADIK